jgi:MFS family permease
LVKASSSLIYFVIFCTGAIRSFTGPTFSSIISQIVPREKLPNATTWNQGTWLSASVTGHATGGFLIAVFQPTGTLIAIIILVSAALFVLWKLGPKPPASLSVEKRTWESVKEGIRFVYNTKELLSALTLDLFAVLFGGAVAMVPVYAKDVLHITPIGFGWLNAAADIGSIVCDFSHLFPLRTRQENYCSLPLPVLDYALSFWSSKIFWLSFAALLVSGVMDGISVVIRVQYFRSKHPMNSGEG